MAEFEKSVSFKNWSLKKFEGLFGGDHYKFEAGGTYNVPQGMALHFAKQLAVRELHEHGYNGNIVRGEMLSDLDMKEYMDKCFPVKAHATMAEPNSFERIDIVDAEAKPAEGVADANKTIEVEQQETSEDDEADVTDEKNNAGAPKFKAPVGRPRKDAQYVK